MRITDGATGSFPPRVVVAVIVAAVLAGLAVMAATKLPCARDLPLTRRQCRRLAAGVATIFALLSAWVVYVLPAYWD